MCDPQPQSPDCVTVGRVLGAHGRDGGLNIRVFSDVADRFNSGRTLLIDGRSFKVAHSCCTSPTSRRLWLEELSRRDQAMALQGFWLLVPVSDVPEPDGGEYFHFQLLGMAVHTENGELLGNISEILETGSNDVYVVAGQGEDLLLPAIAQVVLEVDVPERRMIVRLLEGLR